ncbi:MAG: PQQ-dependent sugar dehydrogenase [Planctomycetota bacterium]
MPNANTVITPKMLLKSRLCLLLLGLVLVQPLAFAVGDGNDLLPDIPIGTTTVKLQDLGGFGARVTDITHANDSSGRVFVVTPEGTIRVIAGGALQSTPFLTIVAAPADRALTGLAFHPQFASNRKLYVITGEATPNVHVPHYSPAQVDRLTAFDNVVVEYQVDAADPNVVDLSTRRELLRIHQADKVHNINDLVFGTDGYLYLAVGDGGGTLDGSPAPFRDNAQQLDNPYGKILRIDVDTVGSNGRYGIPASNPHATGAVPEIFAIGLRNPWRICSDPVTGDLYTATVGYKTIESLVRVQQNQNYGWPIKEGSFLYDAATGDANVDPNPSPVFTAPLAEYDHNGTVHAFGSIIGGAVYRGSELPALVGKYICLDWLAAKLLAIDTTTGAIEELLIDPSGAQLAPTVEIVIGEAEDGELYIGRSNGGVVRIGGIVPAEFRRGDCTGDGVLALDDVICSLGHQFIGLATECQDALDVNDDGGIDLADVVLLLDYMFLGGTMPALPGIQCGIDPTADLLTCAQPASCP